MSAVSSVTGGSPDLYEVMQNVSNSSASTTSTPATTTTTDPATTETTHHHHGHHGGGGAASKIESAVTSALQSAPQGSDPNAVIKDAITQALQPNGADPTTGAPQSTAGTGSPSATSSSSPADFSKLLASYGVDSQQFEQDLQTSLPANGSGSPDFSTMLKSFPPGSLLQATG